MRIFVCSVLLITFLSTLFLIQSAYAYDNVEFGFSITPPIMWNVVEDTHNIEYYYTIGFVKSDSSASIHIFAIVSGPQRNGTLSDFSEGLVDTAQHVFSDFNLVYETRRVVGGLECYEIEFTHTILGDSERARQVFFVENGTAFSILYARAS